MVSPGALAVDVHASIEGVEVEDAVAIVAGTVSAA